MKTIERLLRLSGGLNELDCFERVFVYKKPYLPIYVRYLGTGPRDYPLIAVGQFFYKKEGEELESEVTFEIDTSTADQWGWYPVSFRLGDPPMSHACAWTDKDGFFQFDHTIETGINTIVSTWEGILEARGYLEIDTLL